MKLLMIDNSPSMGGSVHSAALLLAGLTARRVQVGLLASRPDLFAPLVGERVQLLNIAWEGFADVFAPEHGMSGGGLPIIGQKLALRKFGKKIQPDIQKLIEEFQPDLVHLNNLNLPQRPVAEVVRAAGIPYVVHCRMIRFFSQYEAKPAIQAARLICVSEAVRSFMMTHMSLESKRVAVIHNGIDPAPFVTEKDDAARTELRLPLDVPVAVMLGRLAQWKGHHVAIAAWRIVRQRVPGAVLAIVGAGDADYLEQCKALAGRLGLAEAVRFVGHRDDIPRVLQAGDLVVHASCYDNPAHGTVEAFGRVVIEAMAAALPVVATRAGGVSEIVDDKITGRLVRPNDPDGLADAIVHYFKHPDAAFEAGLEGRRRLKQHFTIDHIVDQVVSLYEQVLAG